jgi:hypothetical protein
MKKMSPAFATAYPSFAWVVGESDRFSPHASITELSGEGMGKISLD